LQAHKAPLLLFFGSPRVSLPAMHVRLMVYLPPLSLSLSPSIYLSIYLSIFPSIFLSLSCSADSTPRFCKRYETLADRVHEALCQYRDEVSVTFQLCALGSPFSPSHPYIHRRL
jgi:hypothetical protein